jgi:asparagine synthase (glutamine-hydrolysing)
VALSGEAADEVFGGYPWYHVPALLAAPTFPWAARGSWEPLLQPDVRVRVRLGEYAADRYAQALAEVPRLAGESQQDRRIREVLYLGLTRWLPFLLDRKDRLSMASGLQVPFTDHRLVEYVWNVPWPIKEAGGIEKGLLRTAANGLLPADLLRRRKSIYPGAADQAYERAIDAQLHQLLAQPDAPLFDLISRERLTAAYSADPRLPGLMSVQPSSTSPVAYLLDVNRWLERSGVTILKILHRELTASAPVSSGASSGFAGSVALLPRQLRRAGQPGDPVPPRLGTGGLMDDRASSVASAPGNWTQVTRSTPGTRGSL